MTPHELQDHASKLIAECAALMGTKNKDYSRGHADALRNFKSGAEEFGTDALKVWGIYFKKHYDAIRSFITTGKVESEPIRERIKDAINYMILLSALVEEMDNAGVVNALPRPPVQSE